MKKRPYRNKEIEKKNKIRAIKVIFMHLSTEKEQSSIHVCVLWFFSD